MIASKQYESVVRLLSTKAFPVPMKPQQDSVQWAADAMSKGVGQAGVPEASCTYMKHLTGTEGHG